MKLDKRNNELIRHLDFNSITINKVGPIWDNACGWRMEFSFDDCLNPYIVYDSNDWT
jgi:hypothetical protein